MSNVQFSDVQVINLSMLITIRDNIKVVAVPSRAVPAIWQRPGGGRPGGPGGLGGPGGPGGAISLPGGKPPAR